MHLNKVPGPESDSQGLRRVPPGLWVLAEGISERPVLCAAKELGSMHPTAVAG